MKLAEVYKLAAERLQQGKNHFCCPAIMAVLGHDPHAVLMVNVKAVNRFLELSTPERYVPAAPDYGAISVEMMSRIKDVASKLVAGEGSEVDKREQAHQIETRMRIELLLKVAKTEQAQQEDA